jgi:hypothetical protein
MLKRVTLGLLLALSFSAGQLLGQEGAGSAAIGPRLEVDPMEIDLGAVDRGEDAEARFTLRNTGDQTLKILRAKPG